MGAFRVKSVRALLDAYNATKAEPERVWSIGGWPEEHWDFADFRAWFIHCLNDKINRLDKRTGRKMTDEYQRDLQCDARVIRAYYRDRVHNQGSGLLRTKELQRRYPHINRNMGDD